ncbi:cAMP responsive element modulator b isoform X6 [Triplophysa dalaica]|uniref:cAMP responsive element modulator b isoform X6 n=1 Tax=Triplophysa dalaica TaxID=1582913 RepID=UPI0024E03E36|nr:cAMP responsive element modulator b isoform X6 [Triplophysa dalaica]
MASGNACAQTLLGSSFPAVTRDHLSVGQMIKVKSDMQASWVECKDDQCDDLPESPEKRRLPSRCTASYLKGLLNDQPEKQMYDSGSGGGLYQTSAGSYNSVNWSRSIHMIPSQQTYQTVKMTSGGNRCPGTPMMPYTVHSGDGIQTYIMPDSKVAVQGNGQLTWLCAQPKAAVRGGVTQKGTPYDKKQGGSQRMQAQKEAVCAALRN